MSLLNGLIDVPWWGYPLVVLGVTHMSMAAVTIYLHREQAHRALALHPVVSHFFRFWLWMATGMVTRQWAAVHRKHHARCEGPEDPHSPWIFGIDKVLWRGAELYRKEAANRETVERYGQGCPDDWLERNVYSSHSKLGIGTMLVLDVVLFGPNGVWMWAIQMVWTPFFAAGVINGLAHFRGYRNYEGPDRSTNLVPWGILIAGEELHNNHHAYATSAKLSTRWFEFDIGWFYICILRFFGLAKVHRTPPKIREAADKATVDLETLQVLLANRHEFAGRYARAMQPGVRLELRRLRGSHALPDGVTPAQCRVWLMQDAVNTAPEDREKIEAVVQQSETIRTAYAMRQELAALWERSALSAEQLLAMLRKWCDRAEASELQGLRDFAQRLRRSVPG
jgi:stearoyl-CoA desaturase (delta-9 desaturase)